MPAAKVIDDLVAAAAPGLVATTGPRYFGFVIGGALDSATAADVLAAGWDQPAYNAVSAPAAAVAEEVAGEWLKQLLGLPATASFGFVTGAQAANTVGLAAARHHVLAVAGHDVERDGLFGAPRCPSDRERRASRHDRSLVADARVRFRAGRRSAGRRQRRDRRRKTPGRTRGGSARTRDCDLAVGQREHRRVRRPGRRDRGRPRARARGCTSTARSGSGRRPARRPAISSPGSRLPTRGAVTGTSG